MNRAEQQAMKSPVQKEFEVYKDEFGRIFVKDFYREGRDSMLSQAWHYAIDDRGMGFEFQLHYSDGTTAWFKNPTDFNDDGTPAKCIKVRCWME